VAYRGAFLNFSKGVISPELRARFDVSIYHAALKRAENVIILRTGGVTKRPGTRFVAECLTTTDERLIPFQFSDEQAYALEHAQSLMRPLALGGAVLEDGLAVTAITKAANAKVTVAYHGFVAGDPVYFNGITGMVEINDRFLNVVNVIDADNFTVNFDSTSAGTFTGSGGGTTRSAPPAAPPAAPTVPPPIVEPEPPPIGGGGGGGFGGGGQWVGGSVHASIP
jgi:hypothetical protein